MARVKTQEDFAALVKHLDAYARKEPHRYRARVGLLAVLGYAYIFLMLAVLIGLLIGLIVLMIESSHVNALEIKGGLFLLILAWIIVRSLWVQIPPPQGLALSRHDVPMLFQMLDDVTGRLKAATFHHVLLTDDFNAGVQQVPRLGLFGWQVNYLVLGLPLMQALSPAQFQAVVAHEIGHLSGNHSRFHAWIYRIRKTWIQLLENLHQHRHQGATLFTSFFTWYAPYFSAYSFVLARTDEYEADRCAAEITGRQTAAEALVNIAVKGHFLDEDFWPTLFKQAREQADPPPTPLTQMFQAMHGPTVSENAPQWLGRALGEKTDNQDTHPALADRLAALGYESRGKGHPAATEPVLPPPGLPLEETAAQRFLGDKLGLYVSQLEAAWQQGVAQVWRRQYTYAQETQRKLADLEARAAQGQVLTAEEQWNRAQWTAEYGNSGAAAALYHEILAKEPSHAPANYALGALLLEEKNVDGLDYLEKAMLLDAEAILPACQAAYGFLKQAGRPEDAEKYERKALARVEVLEQAKVERENLQPGDKLLPSELPEEVIVQMRRQIERVARVREAYVVRKAVQFLPEKPLFIVGVVPKMSILRWSSKSESPAIVKEVVSALDIPGNFYVVALEKNYKKMGKSMTNIPGALFFRR